MFSVLTILFYICIFVNFFPTEAETLTPLFKSVALHYHKYFNFGFIQNPTKDDMAVFQYHFGLPGMIVLISNDFANKDPESRESPDYDFNVIQYSPEKQGTLNYVNIIKFLFSINYQFRKTLPGMNYADDEEILQMEEELEIEKLRFNVKYIDRIKEVATLDPLHVRGGKPGSAQMRKVEKEKTKKTAKKTSDKKGGSTKDERKGGRKKEEQEGKKIRKHKEEL